jgi:tetratricopeptide (TPR) repeat protein
MFLTLPLKLISSGLLPNLNLLLRLWWDPAGAMNSILDRGSLLFACLATLATTALLKMGMAGTVRLGGFYMPLLLLAVAYVPGTLAAGALVGRLGSLGLVFQRDYSPLLTCAAMAFSAVEIPLILAAWTAPLPAFLILAALAALYFAVLMFFAVRTVFGTGSGTAAAVVLLSWIPLAALPFIWIPLQFLLGWLATPWFLFLAYYYLAGDVSRLGEGFRRGQHFRRMMEAAAINPHDGEAQYQLGLIAQQRRRYTEAVARFQKAVAIDPTLTDAHFQLGRIAREQGRPRDALTHFQTVVDQNEAHNLSEVLKELGAVYLAARQYQDARNELAVYIERRPYDCEGLYYFGQALENLGDSAAAREAYRRATEADRSAPRYRRRYTARWSRLAAKQLRKV